MRLGLPAIALSVLLTAQSVVASAEPPFDETRRAVLPGEAATTILKAYVADGSWSTAQWPITPEDLNLLETGLAAALAKSRVRQMSLKTSAFYRQYMPARWNGLRLIVVNGFYKSASDMFPDKGIDPNAWKHELLTAFGGGCAFWRTVYIVEQDRFMVLKNYGGRGSKVICNAPK